MPLAKGEKIGCWGLTENSAGSDAGGTKTTGGARTATHWVLNGSKTFITNGRIADTAVVMAVTDRSKGKKGISAFIVERGTQGLPLRQEGGQARRALVRHLRAGLRGLPHPRRATCSGKEGNGFVDTLRILDRGRIGIAALSVGIAQASLEASMTYAMGRRQFGHAIAEFQAIQFKIADMATRWTRRGSSPGGRPRCATPARSTPCSRPWPSSSPARSRCEVALEAVQIHGGYGFIKEYPVERYLRDSKLGTIGEGTSEVQRLVIARELLGLRGMVR